MAQIELDGGVRLEVDEAFFSLPEDEQQALLSEMVAQSEPAPVGDADIAPATTNNPLAGAGQTLGGIKENLLATAEEVGDVFSGAGKLAAFKATGNPSFIQSGNPFQEQGVAGRAAEKTARRLEDQPQFENAVSVQDAFQKPLGFQEGSILPNLVRAGVDRAISGGPSAAVAALPGVGIPALSVSTQRDVGEGRAARDGREAPTTGDFAVGGLAAVPEALLERIGLKGTAGIRKAAPVQGALNQASQSVAARILGGGATEAATGAAQGAIQELATGIATEEGTSMAKLGEAIGDEVLGGFAGGVGVRGGVEGRRKRQEISDRIKTKQLLEQTPDQLAVEEAAVQRLDQERKSVEKLNRNASPLRDDTKIARGAAEGLATDVNKLLAGLREAGDLTEDNMALLSDLGKPETITTDGGDTSAAQSVVSKALNQQRKLGDDDLEVVRSLPIPEEQRATIEQSLRVIDTLTSAGIRRDAAAGPVESTGRIIGTGFGSLGGFALGNALIPGGGVPAAGALATAGFKVGQKAGRAVDQALGLGKPQIVAQTDARRRLLAQQGVQAEDVAGDVQTKVEDNKALVASLSTQKENLLATRREQADAARKARPLANLGT